MNSLVRALSNPDIAVDLGTATTRVLAEDQARALESPSSTAGKSAMRAGVVRDPEAAAAVVRPLLDRTRRSRWFGPRVLACTPTDASADERAALIGAMRSAGASKVVVVPEPLAAAVGSGVDVAAGVARMLVDIGEGVTDCAVIRAGQVLAAAAARTACSDLHQAVAALAASRYGVSLSPAQAERITRQVGVAEVTEDLLIVLPGGAELYLAAQDLAAALAPITSRMLFVVDALLRDLPAALGVEVIETGIHLTGGGALLPGMAASIEARTGLSVTVAADPLHAVILGAQTMLPTISAVGLWQQAN